MKTFFFNTIKTKFFIWLIFLVIFIALIFLIFFINQSNYLIKRELTDLGISLVKNLSYSSELAIASEDEIFLKPYLEGIFKEKDVVLVVVYNKTGNIIASNKKIEIEQEIPFGVMQELKKNKSPIKVETLTKKGEEIYDFYSPVFISEILNPATMENSQDLAGFVRVGLSSEKITAQSKVIIKLGFGITLLIIFLSLIIVFFWVDKMTSSIGQFIRGVEIIGGGNLAHRIKIKTGDEIEELSESFNQMAASLQKSRAALEKEKMALEIKVEARTKELKELTEGLGVRVKERTKQLQEKINELERFQRLAVGRELKMIELKKELKRLKKETEKYKFPLQTRTSRRRRQN